MSKECCVREENSLSGLLFLLQHEHRSCVEEMFISQRGRVSVLMAMKSSLSLIDVPNKGVDRLLVSGLFLLPCSRLTVGGCGDFF